MEKLVQFETIEFYRVIGGCFRRAWRGAIQKEIRQLFLLVRHCDVYWVSQVYA